MPLITLSKIQHHNNQQVKIDFEFNHDVKAYIKKLPDVKCSSTHKAFYIPFSKENVNRLFLYLREKKYYVDYSLLKSKNKEVATKRISSKPKKVKRIKRRL